MKTNKRLKEMIYQASWIDYDILKYMRNKFPDQYNYDFWDDKTLFSEGNIHTLRIEIPVKRKYKLPEDRIKISSTRPYYHGRVNYSCVTRLANANRGVSLPLLVDEEDVIEKLETFLDLSNKVKSMLDGVNRK